MLNFNSVLYKILGNRIKNRREDLKINQTDLGEKVGIGRSSITNIENGRQKPPLSIIYKICRELDIDVHTILPTYGEVEEIINSDNDKSSLKPYYEKYGLDENLQREIDNLFNKNTDAI